MCFDHVCLFLRPQPGHAWLTQHYKYGLDHLFLQRRHSHAVIVEDDMLFSPDFLTLLTAAAPLLDADPTLWCVSTWNDNGLRTFEWQATRMVGALGKRMGDGGVMVGAFSDG